MNITEVIIIMFFFLQFFVLFFIPAFTDTGSPGYSPRWVVYRPSASTPVTASHFFGGNREAELQPTNFSPLLLFRVFLSFLFSPPSQRYSALTAVCWDYSIIIIIIIIIITLKQQKQQL